MKRLENLDCLQKDLFRSDDKNKQLKGERLMKVVDILNTRYGKNTITWCACGINQSWKIKQEELSKAATTKINEIPIVNA